MLRIRRAEAADAPLIAELVRDLADFEKLRHEAVATPEDFLRDGFGPRPRFEVAIAEWEGAPAGFALWFYTYSTFQGRHGLWLEDLFVRPAHRGRGIGTALLRHCAEVAAAQGCGRFQWQVLDWNTQARRLYESLGAQAKTEWITMRVEGAAIGAIASGGGGDP
jgi:GNAT superfamily N-acetyltransferase